jgi:hypothetical protein
MCGVDVQPPKSSEICRPGLLSKVPQDRAIIRAQTDNVLSRPIDESHNVRNKFSLTRQAWETSI